MSKAKRDPEMELQRRKRIVFLFVSIPITILFFAVVGFAIYALIDIYTNYWLPSSNEEKLLITGAVCVFVLVMYFFANVTRIEELEEIVKSEEKKFPSDILDRPIKHKNEDNSNAKN